MERKNEGARGIILGLLMIAIIVGTMFAGLNCTVEAITAQQLNKGKMTTSAPKGIAPPYSVRASGIRTSQATISWSKVKGAQMYTVLINDKSIGDFTELGSTTKTTIDITGLFPGTQYYVKVVSIKDGVSSRPSSYICFRTLRY